MNERHLACQYRMKSEYECEVSFIATENEGGSYEKTENKLK